jgi:hypothetical protein
MPRKVTQSPRVLILRLALDIGGKKHAELHLGRLIASRIDPTGGDRRGT